MTPELEQIRDEIAEMQEHKVDIPFLEALANNALYVLNKIQRENDQLSQDQRGLIDTVVVDLLSTIDRELLWAKQEKDDEDERKIWFLKARRQILRDIKRIFEEM